MDLFVVQDYISTQLPKLEQGRDLFVYSMPETVSKGVLLVAETANARVDDDIPGLFHNRFQVIVRHVDYTEGYAQAKALFDTLNVRMKVMGAYRFDYIKPMHLPIPYRRGASDQLEFSVNFQARYIEC
jgi:hypothetical protein